MGYELKDNKKPVTKEDLMALISEMSQIKLWLESIQGSTSNSNNIFEEIKINKYEGDKKEP